jgi:transposase-like protein
MKERHLETGYFSCPNPNCTEYGLKHNGNIAVRGSYGKDKRPLLYCRTCGKRFASTTWTAFYGAHLSSETILSIIRLAAEGTGVRATARLLGMDKNTVNDVILRIGVHCAKVLDQLLTSLSLTDVQLDELWAFVKKKNVMSFLKMKPNQRNRMNSRVTEKNQRQGADELGSGQP